MVIIEYKGERPLPHNFTGKTYHKFGKDFRKNKELYRYYGAADFYNNGNKRWWFNGGAYGYSIHGVYNEKYNQKHFFKRY